MTWFAQMARLIIALSIITGLSTAYAESIPLRSEGGTFVLRALINEKITLDFTLDSGAAEVSIPSDVFSTLLSTHTISEADLLPSADFAFADGSTHRETRFRIRSLRVGGVELHSVVASVSPPRGTLLLGQSFLSRLQTWTIDNARHMLLINEGVPTGNAAKHDELANGAEKAPSRVNQTGWVPETESFRQCLRRFPPAQNADQALAIGHWCGREAAH